ncbi:hypothetical protein T484DRAFT_1762473 [Baffinella frigidus]|nr:hypothetical protein T484DRAFT_1762473 [Cryptophyta sp. CCMP2293]
MGGDGRKSVAGGVPNDALCSVLAHPDMMREVGWRSVAMLRAVSRGVKATVEDGEDGWQRLAVVLADEAGLYIPPEYAKVADALAMLI